MAIRTKKKRAKAAVVKPRRITMPADVRRGSIHEWLDGVRANAEAAIADDTPRGACLVSDPNGGSAMCVFVDQTTCKLMKGTFVGGPC